MCHKINADKRCEYSGTDSIVLELVLGRRSEKKKYKRLFEEHMDKKNFKGELVFVESNEGGR